MPSSSDDKAPQEGSELEKTTCTVPVEHRERRRQESFNSELSARLSRPRRPSLLQRASSALGPQSVTFRPKRPELDSVDGLGGASPVVERNESRSTVNDSAVFENAASNVPCIDTDIEAQFEASEPRLFPKKAHLREYMMQEVPHNYYLEAQLIFLTFGTGIIDTMTYVTYNCFVSKQTGNAILITLWANQHAQISGGVEANVGFAMLFFVLGSVFFGHVGHLVRQRRRAWLLISNLIQTLLVYIAVIIRYTVEHTNTGYIAVVVVSLLAFACGGQISLALCVRLPELNTTMITGTLIQLSTDRKIFHLHNEPRNRRLLFFFALVAGAFVGAATAQYGSQSLCLLIFGIVKTIAMCSFLLNHGVVGAIKDKPQSGTVTPLAKILFGD